MDFHQSRQIKRQGAALRQVEDSALHRQQQANNRIEDLEARLERLMLVTESMWELLCQTTGLTPEHLHHKLYELDGRDGKIDGRRVALPADCRCGAKVSARSKICQFCGEAAPPRSAFDAV